MKKLTIFALVCVIALGACQAAPIPPNSAPTVDVAGTISSISNTSIAQTFEAQPSPTLVPVILDTATAPIPDASATNTAVVNTDTPQANLTTTPVTATSGPADSTSAPTATPTTVSGAPTLTPTLGVLTYGTLHMSRCRLSPIKVIQLSSTRLRERSKSAYRPALTRTLSGWAEGNSLGTLTSQRVVSQLSLYIKTKSPSVKALPLTHNLP
jgi:hypothetical protein